MHELNIVAQIHLLVGTVAVSSGFLILLLPKGEFMHRIVGRTFVITMTSLCLSGFYLSYTRSLQFTYFLALVSLYLVLTGWFASARDSTKINIVDRFGFVVMCSTAILTLLIGSIGWLCQLPHPSTEPPYPAYYIVTAFSAFIAYLDWLVIKQGKLEGNTRLVRHIWRMMCSLFIATFIFFTGNTHVLPEYLRQPLFLALPIIVVLLALIYWVIKAKSRT